MELPIPHCVSSCRRLVVFIVAMLCALVPVARANDVFLYVLDKSQVFFQTNAGASVFTEYGIYSFAVDRNFHGTYINSLTVDFPGGPLTFSPQATPRKPTSLVDLEALASFPTLAELDAAFPNGDFTFNFHTINDGSFPLVINLSGNVSSFPAAPRISNFTAAQTIDPASDFILRWDAFPGGTTNNLIILRIYDGTNLVFETGFLNGDFNRLDGTTTSVLIPASTLRGLTSYRGILTFVNSTSLNPCTCGTGVAGYESTTFFDLQTTALRRSPSDIFPITVNGVNNIANDLAFGDGNYLAAVIGRQNLNQEDPVHGEVLGVLVGRDGTVIRTAATGHFSSSAAVAYGTTNFLLVWDDDQNNIFGQLIQSNGITAGDPFQISFSPYGTEHPDVAFNGTNFLVVWTSQDFNNEYTLPRAQLVTQDGTIFGGEIILADGAFEVEVAAGAGRFLAIALDSDTESGVYGQFVDGDGELLGPVISIDTSPAKSNGPKEVFFDATAQRFVVTFQDGTSLENVDLFARTVELNGSVGSRKTIATGSGFQGAAHLASDGHLLLMTWVNGIFSPVVTSRAQFFDSNLTPVGAEMITFLQHSNKVPFVAPVQFDGSRYLIINSVLQLHPASDGDSEFVNGDAYGRFITPSTPGFLNQPRSQTIAVGAVAAFAVEATGPPPLTYQWQRNGVNIPGASSPELVLSNVTQNATIRVIVGNSFGNTTSQAAQLTVLPPPTILVQPVSSLLLGLNQQVTFSVVATGAEPLSYQWRLNGITIPGATSPNLTVQSTIETQGSYSVAVANAVGATNSAEASLTLLAPTLDFKDTFAQRNVISGADALGGFGSGTNTFATKEIGEPNHAGKTGGASVWYGWVAPDDGIVTFSTTGSGFDTLLAIYTGTSVNQLTPVVSDDDSGGNFASRVTFNTVAGTEYIVAVDGLGARMGRIFLQWGFTATALKAPVIIASPASRSVTLGTFVSLQVTLQDAIGAQYQWFKDGAELSGAMTNPLAIPSFQLSDVGSYVVRVSNGSGVFAFSAPAFVELGGTITTQDKLEDARLNPIIVGGVGALRTKSSVGSVSAGTVITHNYNATKESLEPNHAGVIGGASRMFVIQVSTAGLISFDTIGSDFDTVLAVYADSYLMPVAQDNNGAPDGIRSRLIFSASPGVSYIVVVDGVDGAQGTIVLNYVYGAAPEIVQGPMGKSVIAGNDFTLSVVAAEAPDLSYLWRRNGVPIPGATGPELMIPNCLPADAGTYVVEVSNSLGKSARAANIAVLGADTPPLVAITEPLATAILAYPTNIHLAATVTAYLPQKVEYFVNKKKVGEAVTWDPLESTCRHASLSIL